MKILRRTVIIFLIGLTINVFSMNHIDFGQLRIMSVLQRIALGYCVASFIILGFREFYVIILTAVILLGYWAILSVFGGDAPFSLEGNFVRVFDAFVLGTNHIPVYEGVKFDMTGLLSTLPSIANILLGYFSGRIIDLEKNKINVVKKLFLYGAAGVLVGLAWSLVFPINKLLWSSSYVVYTSGLAMLFLGIFYWIIDIKGYQKWSFPALVYGMNPLFIYVLAAFWVRILVRIDVPVSSGENLPVTSWIYLKMMVPFAGNMVGSLLYALHLGVIFFLIAWWLYHKKVFIKL
jgi:predicted acyltransferase